MEKELQEKEALLTVTYGTEAWGLKKEKKDKLEVMEVKGVWSLCEVTRMDRVKNVET